MVLDTLGGDETSKWGCLGHWGVSLRVGTLALLLSALACWLRGGFCFVCSSCDTGSHNAVHFFIYLKDEDKLKRTCQSVSLKEPFLFENC